MVRSNIRTTRLILIFLSIIPIYAFADRYGIYNEDYYTGGGSDKILIYLALIFIGYVIVSALINVVKDAIRETREDVDSGRLALKTEIKDQIKRLVKQEIRSLTLTQKDYLLNLYIYGLGFVLGGLIGVLQSQPSISSVIFYALLIGIFWSLIAYILQ